MAKASRNGLKETERLLKVVYDLRRKCPWDRKQTHRTLIPYLVEEAYETVDAIESGDEDALREELGDLLLQVVLHAELESQKRRFTFEDVARGIAEKMIRRHPHVYKNEAVASNLKGHSRNWTKLKELEKPKKTLLEGTPRALPGLQLAQRYGEIAASVGFDWEKASQVLDKVKEELGELETELRRRKKRKVAIELELGDLFFSLANLARHLGVDADAAARKSAAKFADRFTKIEKKKRAEGKSLTDCTMEELDRAWESVKR
jgi:tetrapyrrole methylase family protein / MazG family protein